MGGCPSSKYYHCNASFAPFRESKSIADYVEDSLKKLQVSQVDLLLLHWACDKDDDTLAAYKAMEELLDKGKTRALGVSNFNSAELKVLLPQIKTKPSVNQCRLS